MQPSTPKNTCASVARIRDPRGAYPEQFQTHVERQHYSPATITPYRHCLNVLGRQMRALNVDLKDLDEDGAVALIAGSKHPSSSRKHHAVIIRSCITFLTPLGSREAERGDDTRRHRARMSQTRI